MLMLKNGYQCSEPKIFPSNWKTLNASLKNNWGVQYRIYPPGESKPTQVIIKKGVNKFHTLKERKTAVFLLLTNTLADLHNDVMPYPGYKPKSQASKEISGVKTKKTCEKLQKTSKTLRDLWRVNNPWFDEIMKHFQEPGVAFGTALVKEENGLLSWIAEKKYARGFIHICLQNNFINALPGKSRLTGNDIIDIVNNTFPNIKIPINSVQDWNQTGLGRVHASLIDELKAMMRLQ